MDVPYLSTHDAGWSSSVARRAHNPKVAGSNPAPATKGPVRQHRAFFVVRSRFVCACDRPSISPASWLRQNVDYAIIMVWAGKQG